MGYFAEPPGTFALWVNDEKLIEIPAISEKSIAWLNADKTVSLKNERDTSRREMGLLTLPSSKVTPGRLLRLKVAGGDSNSRRWLSVCETDSDPGARPQ